MAADARTRSGKGLGKRGSLTDRGKSPRNRRKPVASEDRNLSLPKRGPKTPAAAADTTKETGMVRIGTAADIDRIESLTLEDYAAEFSKVQIPEGDVTDAEVDAAVKQFLDMLRKAPEVCDGR